MKGIEGRQRSSPGKQRPTRVPHEGRLEATREKGTHRCRWSRTGTRRRARRRSRRGGARSRWCRGRGTCAGAGSRSGCCQSPARARVIQRRVSSSSRRLLRAAATEPSGAGSEGEGDTERGRTMCEWATRAVQRTPSRTGLTLETAVAPMSGTSDTLRRRSNVQWYWPCALLGAGNGVGSLTVPSTSGGCGGRGSLGQLEVAEGASDTVHGLTRCMWPVCELRGGRGQVRVGSHRCLQEERGYARLAAAL